MYKPGDKILFNGKTPREIAEHYFGSTYVKENYSNDEYAALIEGFVEGFEYLFPMYDNAQTLIKLYEKTEE